MFENNTAPALFFDQAKYVLEQCRKTTILFL